MREGELKDQGLLYEVLITSTLSVENGELIMCGYLLALCQLCPNGSKKNSMGICYKEQKTRTEILVDRALQQLFGSQDQIKMFRWNGRPEPVEVPGRLESECGEKVNCRVRNSGRGIKFEYRQVGHHHNVLFSCSLHICLHVHTHAVTRVHTSLYSLISSREAVEQPDSNTSSPSITEAGGSWVY